MIKENIIETPTPSSGTELDERDASVEEAPVEQAPVEEASSSTQESSSEVGAADAAEGLLAKLEEELKEKEGLEALFDNLEARVSGDVAENVAPFDEATPGQGTPDQRNSGQGNSGQGNSDQEAADQEASGEGKKEEKPKKSVIEATKDYFVASAGALFDFLIEMLAAIKKFILQGNEGKTQAKTGSDFEINDSKEQKSRGKNVSPPQISSAQEAPQISSAQEAESPLKSDEGNTSNVPGDLTSEETQSESDKPKGSLQDRLSNLIASCIHDPEKMKTVKEFLEKGTEGLGGEELENFDKFKKIVNDEIDKQKGAKTNQTATGNDVEESLKESKAKESSEKSEVKESSEKSENINSLDQVVEGLGGEVSGGEVSEENETSKKEFKDIPELDEVRKNLASGGAMRSDEGNSSSAPAPAAISAPAASKGDNGR